MKHDRICIVINDDLRKKLRVTAATMDIPLSELVRLAIDHYLTKILQK